jgi:hypothetical protein
MSVLEKRQYLQRMIIMGLQVQLLPGRILETLLKPPSQETLLALHGPQLGFILSKQLSMLQIQIYTATLPLLLS